MSQYARGARFERAAKAHLESAGYVVIRAAGSHGEADLVALRAGGSPLLVSCRINGKLGPLEREALHDAAKRAGGYPVLACRPARGRIELRDVQP